jgi:hypothetical protein
MGYVLMQRTAGTSDNGILSGYCKVHVEIHFIQRETTMKTDLILILILVLSLALVGNYIMTAATPLINYL